MRRMLAAGLALVAVGTAAAQATPARPVLRLLDSDPVTVKGMRFDPDATVRVRAVTYTRSWSRQVDVGASGAFVVRFPIDGAGCGIFVRVVAKASDGTRAVLGLPAYECPRD